MHLMFDHPLSGSFESVLATSIFCRYCAHSNDSNCIHYPRMAESIVNTIMNVELHNVELG
jgi:hypothetical protein